MVNRLKRGATRANRGEERNPSDVIESTKTRRNVCIVVVGLALTTIAIFRMTRNLKILPSTLVQVPKTSHSSPDGGGSNSNKKIPIKLPDFGPYQPAPVETYVLEHVKELKLDVPMPEWTPSCDVYTDSQSTPYHAQLQDFIVELEHYSKLVKDFQIPIKDLRRNITEFDNGICDLVQLHPGGMQALFSRSRQLLSLSSSGWVEPLLPPMRHAQYCFDTSRENLMRIDYILHDFHALCRKLKPHSRTILVDMGASLRYWGKSPVLDLIQLYSKFGFHFDHIYGYEYEKHDPDQVFNDVPQNLDASYHWINVGVVSDTQSRRNPFKLLQENYSPDDLIIVKLDVDTPALERELAQQLLDNPKLSKLIDHFYFEHHVNQEELKRYWGRSAGISESVADSLRFFHEVRKKGIPAHFWV
ncbi:expressed unknown protein [Seminavis robusta]|uniref:Uncharacterized protein n=1 Tax=Seminavis robusta TaxID=568900 RepID=A0A9N8HFX8_9STRA|nr:expressed unknown protein [Seminavis robusta]|eukprot:Sro546_g164010.1 n/a (415) ;mRNA; f:14317-15561